MPKRRALVTGILLGLLTGGLVLLVRSAARDNQNAPPPARHPDPIADAQAPREIPVERPETKEEKQDLVAFLRQL